MSLSSKKDKVLLPSLLFLLTCECAYMHAGRYVCTHAHTTGDQITVHTLAHERT